MINLVTLQENLENLSQTFKKGSFIFDLLAVYGLPKSTISLLSKNPSKLSGKENQVILKNKLLFHITTLEEDEHVAIDSLQKDKNSYKFNPRFIIVTDFVTFLAVDTKTKETLDIQIGDLGKHYAFFLPWCGMEKSQHANENPADIRAAYKMDKLYQAIVNDDPEYYKNNSHDLNIFLSRLLFCFFAEDTGIFPKIGMFTNSVNSHTHENGEEMDTYFSTLFDVLNAKNEKRSGFASHFLEFPYVNGGLFETKIKLPTFTTNSRKLIIESGKLDWSSINPDIFGSMIQAVVHPGQRESLGMHYTSVPNIMKVIEPLFLNNLYEELENSKDDIKKLTRLRDRISKIRIFDPACGSGNFLIISYKELCQLEIEIIKRLNLQDSFASLEGWNSTLSGITLNNFYGIEIDDFAHEIAKLSLYLAQHQINQKFEKEFGKLKPILPLKESGKIMCANATRVEWDEVCPRTDQITGEHEVYAVGNPPYLGYSLQEPEQKEDLEILCKKNNIDRYKELDYIACWFIKAVEYIKDTQVKVALVSTNSITQGEQVQMLWPFVLDNNVEISFAHQSFKWKNLAKGNAGVTCVIIGLQSKNKEKKTLFKDNIFIKVDNINPYLASAPNLIIESRSRSVSDLPKMVLGNMAKDGGYLFLDKDDINSIREISTKDLRFVKKTLGSAEFIKAIDSWCLWIEDKELPEAVENKFINDRLEKVRAFRLKSKADSTSEYSEYPNRFKQRTYQPGSAIIVPRVSSERREYLPVGFVKDVIIKDSAYGIYDPEPYIFSLLSSKMHIVWIKAVCGSLETRIRYSSALGYNTFPFPGITPKQKESLATHVYNILEEREKYPEKTMADLYDPDKMPVGLREAHKYLDLAIDQIYRNKPFESDEDRLAHLFKLYEEMITRKTNE